MTNLSAVQDRFSPDGHIDSNWVASWVYWAGVVAYALLGWFLAFQPLEITFDEPSIMDPALQIAEHQALSIPSAGPGASHAEAYFYQTPLHPFLLGYWLRVFGETWESARSFSYAIGFLILFSLHSFRRLYGMAFPALGVWVLLSESSFFQRMTIVRYDGLAILFTILAIRLILSESGFVLNKSRWLGAGCCLGIAISSHFLYGIYVPALLGALLLENSGFTWIQKSKLTLFLCLGVAIALIPVGIYALLHSNAFWDQFVFQIKIHRDRPVNFVAAELAKYRAYFYRRPLLPIFYTTASLWLLICGAKRINPFNSRPAIRLFFFTLLFLTLASGGKYWHVAVAIPAMILVSAQAGASFLYINQEKLSNNIRSLGYLSVGIALLAIINGLLIGPLGAVAQSLLDLPTRSDALLADEATKMIPADKRVYGTRKLLLTAHRNHWDFVADYQALFNTSSTLGFHGDFDWVVVQNGLVPDFLRLQQKQYILINSLIQPTADSEKLILKHPLLGKWISAWPSNRYDFYQNIAPQNASQPTPEEAP